MASEWAMERARNVVLRAEFTGPKKNYIHFGANAQALVIADALDAAREHGRSESATEISELRKDKERLEHLFGLRSPYFSVRNGVTVLLETDCGAMRVVGVGNSKRGAIDAAMKGEPK